MSIYEFIVPSNPIPAPRMTRRDSWNPSRQVVRYREFKDTVVTFARNQGVRGELKTPVALSFIFGLAGRQSKDMDNIIKGIKDALVRAGHLSDDTYKEVPAYCDPVEVVCLCDHCPKRLPKRGGKLHDDCGAVKKCNKGFAYIKIVEGVELSGRAQALVEGAVKGYNLPELVKLLGGDRSREEKNKEEDQDV